MVVLGTTAATCFAIYSLILACLEWWDSLLFPICICHSLVLHLWPCHCLLLEAAECPVEIPSELVCNVIVLWKLLHKLSKRGAC
ncbi:hypothetical protein OIU77_004186 [Salix suchowensis]|uniref:Uncharacterized protein n=1 Tax=Salix suchowensis TaxID=1278906 RepID=A0ABQ9ATR9_9ROSI|nr:hypothetical protein OIU77_004186 [Salix suchowensis]